MRREERKNESILTGTHEHLEDLRYFFPYPSWNIKSTNDVVHEIQAPASRYKNPLGWKKQMRVLFGKWLCLPNRIFGKTYACYDFPFPFPLRWKKVFDYIYKAGITQYPYPSFDKMYHDEPKVFGIRLWAKNGETDGSRIKGGYSRGVSFGMEEALSKVVGELLERYPLTIYRNKDLISASISDLRQKKTHFFDPFLLDQFSPWQKEKFPRYRFDDASRFCWVEGISLMTKKKALIPAQMVYWNYQILSNEPILRQMSTSGNGGMFTLTEALLSGLYELIQRDAFMLFWLNRIAPPRIEVTSIKNPEIVSLLESCKNYGLRVSFLDATSDFHIPVVITVLEDEYGGGPSVVLGGGCGLDPEHALIRSLIEAISVRYWLRDRMDKGQSCILPDGMEPFTTTTLNSITRMSYWGSPGMGEKIQFFLQGELRSINQSFLGAPEKNMMPEKQLKHLKKIFQKKGERYEIFYYEAKHEVLDTLGYSSVSVSVPAILPLFMDESRAPLGNPRLQEACRALGYKPAKTINPLPHPFP